MPYIDKSLRKQYDIEIEIIDNNLKRLGDIPGDVTYILYKIILNWWERNKSYKTICAIRGVLVGTMDEFNRREAHPYEDEKIKENGDV